MGNKVQRRLQAIDVFSGCGGLTLGLKQAGFDVIAAIELDSKSAGVYKKNHPSTALHVQDVRGISGTSLLDAFALKQGDLDLLAGCPPCQGFSRIRHRNKGLVEDDRNALIDDFSRLVETMRPKSVMMENVEAITNFEKFDDFLLTLNRCGYSVDFAVLDAASFGVPQRRRRLILLASSVGLPKMAKPSAGNLTVHDAIGALAAPGSGDDMLHNLPEKRSARIKKIIEMVPLNGGSRSALPKRLILKCHKKSDGFADVYGRMAWNKPAPTITSGCSNPSKGRFLHPDQDRCITLREAALLQGFPEKYHFDAALGKESIALMIGNALPPPFVKAHAQALKATILAAET